MAYTNVHRGARISPTKARPVADLIRGKKADDALTILGMSKRRGAYYLRKALEAAIANADQAEQDVRQLWISDVRVDDGPRMKRFQPKDRGRAHAIIKRSCHLTVAVDVR